MRVTADREIRVGGEVEEEVQGGGIQPHGRVEQGRLRERLVQVREHVREDDRDQHELLEETVDDALSAGADAFISKRDTPERVALNLRLAAARVQTL